PSGSRKRRVSRARWSCRPCRRARGARSPRPARPRGGRPWSPGPPAPLRRQRHRRPPPERRPPPPTWCRRSVVAAKRLGELLLEARRAAGAQARPQSAAGDAGPALTPALLEQALATQEREGGRIGEVLIKMHAV